VFGDPLGLFVALAAGEPLAAGEGTDEPGVGLGVWAAQPPRRRARPRIRRGARRPITAAG